MSNKNLITDIYGNTREVGCLGCAIADGEVDNVLYVFKSEYFLANQDYEVPIPGFVILASKRHLESVDQFNEDEEKDFIDALIKIRKAMRETLHIKEVYLFQAEGDENHFHVWLFPRYDWMVEKFGKKVQSVRPIMEYAKENLKTKENLEKVEESVQELKSYLNPNE